VYLTDSQLNELIQQIISYQSNDTRCWGLYGLNMKIYWQKLPELNFISELICFNTLNSLKRHLPKIPELLSGHSVHIWIFVLCNQYWKLSETSQGSEFKDTDSPCPCLECTEQDEPLSYSH
jgi:hypothetical protein